MKRSWAVTLAVIGLIDLLGIAYVWTVPNIEADLTSRANVELAKADIREVSVKFDGRNGSVDGASAAAAETRLASLRGARWVRAVTSVDSLTAAAVRMTRSGQSIVIDGTVETQDQRQALMRAVTRTGFEADDSLTTDRNIDGSDIAGLLALVEPMLTGSDDGELVLLKGTITLTGSAADPVEAAAIESAIAEATSTGVEVNNKVSVIELSEVEQITALQAEIDQIFELARAIEGQQPNFGSSDELLSAETTRILDRVTIAMRRYPLPSADVAGHTDSEGPAEENKKLSKIRAESVVDYLAEGGVSRARLTAVGRGESEPIADNSTPDGKAENRRVDFLVKKSRS